MITILAQSQQEPQLAWVYDSTAKVGYTQWGDQRLKIMYKGVLYYSNGQCTVGGKNALQRATRAKLEIGRDAAYESMTAHINGTPPAPADDGEPAKPGEPSGLSATFERVLAESLATATADQVYQAIIPDLKKRVYEEIGVIPKRIKVEMPERTHTTEGVVHNKFEEVLRLVMADIPVFITGPAGSGKNYLCKNVSDAMDLAFHFNNALTSEYAMTGFRDAMGVVHETEFRRAWIKGGMWFGDEFDASTPEVAVKLNAALSNGYAEFPDGTFERHETTRIMVAGNTFGTGSDIEYTGRFQLDAATLDRFAIVHVDYDPNIEDAISGGDIEAAEFIRGLRKAVAESGIKYVVSYRALHRLVTMKDTVDDQAILSTCIVKNLGKDDLRIISSNMADDGNRFTVSLRKMAGV